MAIREAAEIGAESDGRFLGGFEANLLTLLFLAAGALTVYGLVSPALHVEQFWFFTRDVSILSAIRELIDNGQTILGWLIFVFSVVVPLAKAVIGFLICAFARDTGPALRSLLGLFGAIGKWSFTEVFILAIAVIVIDGQLLTTANLGPGIYAFGTGALLSWLATMALHARAARSL